MAILGTGMEIWPLLAEGVRIASKSLWDLGSDNWASYTFQNKEIWATGITTTTTTTTTTTQTRRQLPTIHSDPCVFTANNHHSNNNDNNNNNTNNASSPEGVFTASPQTKNTLHSAKGGAVETGCSVLHSIIGCVTI